MALINPPQIATLRIHQYQYKMASSEHVSYLLVGKKETTEFHRLVQTCLFLFFLQFFGKCGYKPVSIQVGGCSELSVCFLVQIRLILS